MTKKMSEKAAKSDVKVVKNTIKVEGNTMKEAKKDVKVDENVVIMDATDATKAKTKALNSKKAKKGGDIAKKPAKRVRKTSKPKKGGSKMDHNEQLVKVLKTAANKNKDLELVERLDRSGAVTTYQLKKGGDNVVCIRKTDVIAYRPIGIFSKALMLKTPWFKKFGKDENGKHSELYTHIVHIRKHVDVDVFKQITAKAVGDKKTVAEWKVKTKAVVKARTSKKTSREQMSDLQASIKRQQEQLKALKAAKVKVKKATKKKPAVKAQKKGSNVIAKAAELVA